MKRQELMLLSILMLLSAEVRAVNVFWDSCNGGWMVADNWAPRLPISGDVVYIDNGCGGPLITSGNAVANTAYVGFDAVGNTLEQKGIQPNSLSVASLYLGQGPGSAGRYKLSGAGQLTATAEYIGNHGTGVFIQDGGNHQASNMTLGNMAGSSGAYQISGTAQLSVTDSLVVGSGGSGVFSQTGGSVYQNSVSIGGGSSYELSGSGSFGTNQLYVPYQSTTTPLDVARFVQSGGVAVAPYVVVGWSGQFWNGIPAKPGRYELSGGEFTDSRVTVSSGTIVQTGGKHTVTGNDSVYGVMRVGERYDGSYELSGTGVLTMRMLQLGGTDGFLSSEGRFTQDGGTHTVLQLLSVGAAGSGVYQLRSGKLSSSEARVGDNVNGSFTQFGGAHSVESLLYVAYGSGAKGVYELKGGSISARTEYIGWDGEGEMIHTAGINTANQMFIGRQPRPAGSQAQKYTLSGTGELVARGLTVARATLAFLTLNGGRVSVQTMEVGRLTGKGTVFITDPSTHIAVGQSLTLGANAYLEAAAGSVIHMTANEDESEAAGFDNQSTKPFNLIGLGELTLVFEGGVNLTSTVEVASRDLGSSEAGFIGNFSLSALQVGNADAPAHVELVDNNDNAQSGVNGEPEVLYVDAIRLTVGSALNLSGKTVYYHSLCNGGGTIAMNGGHLVRVGSAAAALDLDCDGDLDLRDLTLFQACATGPAIPQPDPACSQKADLDSDGDVDQADFGIFQRAFTGPR